MPDQFLLVANRISVSFFVIVLIDVLFLHGRIASMLPSNITQFTWYYLLFGLPHIVGSFVSYCNDEYAAHYKKDIFRGLLITFLILIFFAFFFSKFFIYFFIGYTMYHVGWQQLGICRRYIKNKNHYLVWSTSGIVTAVTLALSVGGEALVVIPPAVYLLLQTIGKLSLLIFIISSLPVWKYGEYAVTTSLIFILSAISILSGYYIVGILMVRFIHDISAFSIYIQHDTAYQNKSKRNYIYNFFKIQPSFIIVFLPLFSIAISFILQRYVNFVFAIIILVLSFMHYYLEGIVWKRGTLHRNTLG